MSNLFETLSTATRNQSDLINAGIEPSQATRIAFDNLKVSKEEVDKEWLNQLLKRAFIRGQVFGIHDCMGKAKQSQGEAIKDCIKEINQML